LDVPGRALIEQADARIRWHKKAADTLATELNAIPVKTGTSSATVETWQQQARRTDLERRILGHHEHARFLTFVRQHIVRNRLYRVELRDMSLFEIMPKGTYY